MDTTKTENLYQRLTNDIIAKIEAGTLPWRSGLAGGLPRSAITQRAYNGTNILSCLMHQLEYGYATMQYVTFNQIKQSGGFVNRGSKGCQLVLVRPIADRREEGSESDGENGNDKVFLLARTYTVFSLDQCSGVDALREKSTGTTPRSIAECEILIERSGIPLRYQGHRAYYSPADDLVTVPERSLFHSSEDLYSTIVHECIHATGHSSRLNRDLSGRFGSRAYSAEELVGELGAVFTLASFGLENVVDNSAAYLSGWVELLKDDPRAIATASSLAGRAADYLLRRAGFQSE